MGTVDGGASAISRFAARHCVPSDEHNICARTSNAANTEDRSPGVFAIPETPSIAMSRRHVVEMHRVVSFNAWPGVESLEAATREARFIADRLAFPREPVKHPYALVQTISRLLWYADAAERAGDMLTTRRLLAAVAERRSTLRKLQRQLASTAAAPHPPGGGR
jgi:hypothetical protein